MLVVLLALALCPVACATYREDLNRGQRMYEENKYEHALALWRVLEDDSDSLSPTDSGSYAYLRGMTDLSFGLPCRLSALASDRQGHGSGSCGRLEPRVARAARGVPD